MWLHTPRGLRAALAARRAFRHQHGHGLTYVRHVAADGAFNWSAWRGLTYIGPVTPQGLA